MSSDFFDGWWQLEFAHEGVGDIYADFNEAVRDGILDRVSPEVRLRRPLGPHPGSAPQRE